MDDLIKELNIIRAELDAATPGPWVEALQGNLKGGPLQSLEELVEVIAWYIAKGEFFTPFHAVTLPEKVNGEDIVVCYTGNGPTSKENKKLITNAPTHLDRMDRALRAAFPECGKPTIQKITRIMKGEEE